MLATLGASRRTCVRTPARGGRRHGRGRVVVAADSDLFGDDCIESFDHAQLWLNIAYWAALPAFAAQVDHPTSAAAADPHWASLKAATEELRALQAADATVDLATTSRSSSVRALTDRIGVPPSTGSPRTSPTRPTTSRRRSRRPGRVGRRTAAASRTSAPSLSLFRPELQRVDGIEHLAVLPDVHAERLPRRPLRGARSSGCRGRRGSPSSRALQFHNDKFVPVHLVDNTAGYDSECAVFFPETMSVVGEAANTFGGIFCDREAARYQRVVAAGRADHPVSTCRLHVTALLASEPMTRDMFELWDLIHDRAHSHGELPFDPFMIRQRLPFWMYSLEELRCDLTAFHQAGELGDGLPVRRVRPVRRPVRPALPLPAHRRPGPQLRRPRRTDPVRPPAPRRRPHVAQQHADRRLGAAARGGRRTCAWRSRTLYRTGISSSKVRYWIAAHDLVSQYVQPNLASQWTPEARAGRDEGDHKAWVDLVNPDEFPLSMFYQSLGAKLRPGDRAHRVEAAA